MSWIKTAFVVAALGGTVLPPGMAQAQAQAQVPGQMQGSPFIGRWHLNLGQSTRPPGETLPADLSTDIIRLDAMHVRWSTMTTDAKGQKGMQTFDTPGNGEFYSLDGDTMVSHQLSPTRLQSTFKDADGQTDVLTCTLSANVRTMRCNGVVTHQDGSVATYVDVFDRV